MLYKFTRFHAGAAIGLLLGLWIPYLATVVVAAMAPRYLAAGRTQQLLALLPLPALLLVVGVIYWLYRAGDERLRTRILKCAALTGVILAFGTLGYFCLEQLGYPRLSVIVVNLLGWAVFTVLVVWAMARAR